MLKLVLGITGSIAAYKTPDLVRRLRENNIDVRIVLSAAAREFVAPLSLQAVSGKKVHEQLLDAESEAGMSHIELARWADVVLIAPCSAHFIAKLTHGFADDLLSTLCLATQAKIVLAPAMNQAMWSNTITQQNLHELENRNFIILETAQGMQACGESGLGRMLEPLEIVEKISQLFHKPQLKAKKILITAGPTQEAIDPVRYLSNESSGKMGYALAEAASLRGAYVKLISGPTSLTPPAGVSFTRVKTADEMLQAVLKEIQDTDIFIACAAVADYKVKNIASQKIKKNGASLILELERTVDILTTVAKLKLSTYLVGFSAETQNVLAYAEEKRLRKGIDLIIANDVSDPNIGFNSEENTVTLISANEKLPLAKASKKLIAKQILDFIAERYTHSTEKL